MSEFIPFPKIPRLSREITITEKIDGTNAAVVIGEDGKYSHAQSRSRIITPEADNMGFARWAHENRDYLEYLGPGVHFGEWWGAGIQRRYGLTEKRFSLFNTHRWGQDGVAPMCCHVVPVLYQGPFSEAKIDDAINLLRMGGSVASPGYKFPEGVVIWHEAARQYFKRTLERDEEPKGVAA